MNSQCRFTSRPDPRRKNDPKKFDSLPDFKNVGVKMPPEHIWGQISPKRLFLFHNDLFS